MNRIIAAVAISLLLSACAVPYNQQQGPALQQGQIAQQGQQTLSECKIDGLSPILGVTPEECEKIRQGMTTPKTVAQKEDVSSSGCGVKLAGQLIKELAPRSDTTCQAQRDAFVAKFKEKCHGKNGSIEKDIACGRKIDI